MYGNIIYYNNSALEAEESKFSGAERYFKLSKYYKEWGLDKWTEPQKLDTKRTFWGVFQGAVPILFYVQKSDEPTNKIFLNGKL